MFVLRSQCSRTEWSERPCVTQPFETLAEKYSSCDVSTILLTDENVFTVVTLKTTKNHQLYATAATKMKRRRDKTPAHAVNVQTSVGKLETPAWHGRSQHRARGARALLLSAVSGFLKELSLYVNCINRELRMVNCGTLTVTTVSSRLLSITAHRNTPWHGHTVNVQTSVVKLQVVQKTPAWYLSITESRLLVWHCRV